jgi:hypothetical protein
MSNYKLENAQFSLDLDQVKAVNKILKRLGQIPTSYPQIQKNKQNISQNLQRIKNKKVSTPLDLSKLNQDQFEWLRFNRNSNIKADISYQNPSGYDRNVNLLTDTKSELHGTIIEGVDFDFGQIDSGGYDDGFIIFVYFSADGCRVANDLGNNAHLQWTPWGAYPANVDLNGVHHLDDRVVFNQGDILVLQYDEPDQIWREITRHRDKPTAKNISGTFTTTQEETITVDSSAGNTEIRIDEKDYIEDYQIIIADAAGNASNNQITVLDDKTGNDIEEITQNNGYLILLCDGNTFYRASELQSAQGATSFIDIAPDQETITVSGSFITVSPISSSFLVLDASASAQIVDFDRTNFTAGSLLRVKFNKNGNDFTVYSSTSTGILLQGNEYLAVNGGNEYPVRDGEEKLFIFNGSQWRELTSDNRTLIGGRVVGAELISFWRNPLNQAAIGSSNGVGQIQNLERSLAEVTGTFGAIDPSVNGFVDGSIVTIQFGGRSRVNHNEGTLNGKIFLDGSKDALFFQRDQLTLMYYGPNKHFREIGRTQTEKRVVFDGSSGSTVDTDGESVIYADSTNQSFNVNITSQDEIEGRVIRVIDTGGNSASNAIGIQSNSNIDGSTQISITTNYGSKALIFNGTNWNTL